MPWRPGVNRSTLQSPYERPERFGSGRPSICIDNSHRVGKGDRQVHRQVSSVTRLAAAALLVGLGGVGCRGHGGSGTAQPAYQSTVPSAEQPSEVAQSAPTLAPTPAPTPAPTDSPAPSPMNAAAPTNAAAATPDPLDGQLSNLDNLLNGINGSLSGSDAGPASGE